MSTPTQGLAGEQIHEDELTHPVVNAIHSLFGIEPRAALALHTLSSRAERNFSCDAGRRLVMESQLQYAGATLTDTLVNPAEGAGLQVADLTREHCRRLVIVFVGMSFEAKIAAGPGVKVFSRGSRRELAAMAATATRQGYRGMISFGVAGGLAPNLRPGDWVVASAILESETVRETDTAWSKKLFGVISGASYSPILGTDTPVAEPDQKRQLHKTTGAAAVDMESHVVARLAAEHGLAFASVRVVVDAADRAIPRAALRGMTDDGGTDGLAVLRDLLARPSQLSPLTRIAVDALVARAEMARVRHLLGPHFGLVDFA